MTSLTLLAAAGQVLGSIESVLLQYCKADAGRLAWKGIIAAATAAASSCTPLDSGLGETISVPGETQATPSTDYTHCDPGASQRGPWNYAPTLWAKLCDLLVFYTLQCNKPAAGVAIESEIVDQPDLVTARMRPILDLLTAAPDLLTALPNQLSRHLLLDTTPEDASAKLAHEHTPPKQLSGTPQKDYGTPPKDGSGEPKESSQNPKGCSEGPERRPAGPQEVHAALDALLLLFQHPPLLPHLLTKHGDMPSVLRNCRYALCHERSGVWH